MKRFMMIFLSLWVASAVSMASAQGEHREGVDSTINASDIADLLAWATNSKAQLEDGLKEVAELPTNQRRSALKTLISSVVQSSGVKSTELLMRVVLNRALTVDDLLSSNSQSSSEQESLGRRVLKDAAQTALLVYVDDSQFLNQAAQSGKNEITLDLPIATVGIQSAEYYARRAMSAPTHQATLAILKLDLGLMFNDLNKSQQRRSYAAVLNHIAEFNKSIENEKPSTPQTYLSLNRKIKAFLDDQVEQAKKVPQVNATSPVYNSGGGASGCRGNTIGMQFSCIPGGTFTMGSPSTEPNRAANEIPHRVTVSAFEMQTTDVTQAQWVKVMGSNPSNFKSQSNCPKTYTIQPVQMCPNHPVEQVSFGDVQEYIRKVNETLHDGYKYRLPTEAEWEYAARAGSQTAYYFGDNTSVMDQYAWYSGNSNSQTHDVAKLQANSFGLYDMSGNVWQWVQDWWGDYSTSDQVNPLGAQSGSYRVLRGGSWYQDARSLRSASCYNFGPSARSHDVGFRLMRTN